MKRKINELKKIVGKIDKLEKIGKTSLELRKGQKSIVIIQKILCKPGKYEKEI